MSVTHHLTDETIHDYVVGGLNQSMETLVACHLTVCAACREKVRLADGLGGRMLDELQSRDVQLSARDLISRLEENSAPRQGPSVSDNPTSSRSARMASREPIPGVPRPLGRLLPAPLEELRWRRIAPGIRQYRLDSQPRRQGAFQLLHLAPGVELSEHSHEERELTFLVQGSYHDSIGRFQAGDIADLDGTVEHRPVVDGDVPCIALIATQAPVKFSGMLGKIMQPFVGI